MTQFKIGKKKQFKNGAGIAPIESAAVLRIKPTIEQFIHNHLTSSSTLEYFQQSSSDIFLNFLKTRTEKAFWKSVLK